MIKLQLMAIFKFILIFFTLAGCNNKVSENASNVNPEEVVIITKDVSGKRVAYFASGCFWCVEAIFESLIGVEEVISGYCGGDSSDANYEMVSSGATKHAETVAVYYDPVLIKYETLLKVFFDSHDPTTLNRQGPDSGPQYRSAIFYQNAEEKAIAEAYIARLTSDKIFKAPITTTLERFEAFYPAEQYHQDFEKRNPNQPYVRNVSIPRLKKFQVKNPELLKPDH